MTRRKYYGKHSLEKHEIILKFPCYRKILQSTVAAPEGYAAFSGCLESLQTEFGTGFQLKQPGRQCVQKEQLANTRGWRARLFSLIFFAFCSTSEQSVITQPYQKRRIFYHKPIVFRESVRKNAIDTK